MMVAAQKGYWVTDDGVLIGMKGKPLVIATRGDQRYPTFSVAGVKDVSNKYGVFGIPVHKYAAFCFYGPDSLDVECVRHLNGNVLDVSRSNIVLGTHSENNMDKTKEIRSRAAKIARAAQGTRPINAKFSDEEVRFIRSSNKSQTELANYFGVTRQAIWQIKNRKNYNDVA